MSRKSGGIRRGRQAGCPTGRPDALTWAIKPEQRIGARTTARSVHLLAAHQEVVVLSIASARTWWRNLDSDAEADQASVDWQRLGAKKKPVFRRVECPGQDLNLHALRRCHLKAVRLPIPPPGLLRGNRTGNYTDVLRHVEAGNTGVSSVFSDAPKGLILGTFPACTGTSRPRAKS